MRWGLVGTRGLAAGPGISALTAAEGVELVAVLSQDLGRARAFAEEHGIEVPSAALEDFVRTPGLEAVWITSPTYLHEAQAVAALESGKHVLLEKPLALTAAQGWGLVRAARQAGRILATGYQARYVPGHQMMQRLITEGAIGDVAVARTYYGIRWPGGPPLWRTSRDLAHWGALGDIGTHHVDLIRMLLGEITDARALAGHQLGFETEDQLVAELRLASGALASLTISSNVWTDEHTRVEIHGTDGALVAVDTSPRGQGTVTLLRQGRDPELLAAPRPDAWVAQLETVTRAASGERLAYATGEDGARNLEILEDFLA